MACKMHDLLVADILRMREILGKGDPDDPLPKTYRRGHTRDQMVSLSKSCEVFFSCGVSNTLVFQDTTAILGL